MFKNTASQKVLVYANDATTGVATTGDAANITAYISKDGGSATQSNDVNPTEINATNMKGFYLFDVTQSETNADLFVMSPVSATASVILDAVGIYTETAPPTAAATATAVWAEVIENSNSAADMLRGCASVLFGLVSRMDSNNPTFRDLANAKDRFQWLTDENGNRIKLKSIDLT